MKTIACPNILKLLGFILFFCLAFSGASYGQETKSPTVPPPPAGVKQPEFPKPPDVPKVNLSKPPDMKVPGLPKAPEVKRPTSSPNVPARLDTLEEKMRLLEGRVKALEDAKK
jgi:hypothetical protein